ncbi:hypothetical protein PBI_RYAN_23 [Arthrobacter phage Ryan]|uniref:Uncharacterized protein n=2 Tax=Nanditavirus TaxID=3152637 RepID=A0A3G2KJ20_9CAUD|nr:hypothetical protein QEO75_gp23 [Arthrobacter phage Ryan]YP_010761052.1 membrane protein [Arthrobacter phage Zaheer]AYN59015.1 hypothetical protein PBI_RYAN_23 [Arthrobacter phage Ryan]QWY84224.1 membrane protein [Arthrobacter phage Zaheer]
MDAGVITATTGFLGAVVALLGALGGGIAFLIRRADKKRETGEALMLNNLKGQIRDLKALVRWKDQIIQFQQKDGTAWREQLLRHDIEPEPAEWTEWPAAPVEKEEQ